MAEPRVPVPVTLVAGIDASATALVTVAAQWDVPSTVVVRHEVHADRGTLTRTISDAGGLVEQVAVPLAHACTGCALREDVLPTLARLGRSGRWNAIVAHLPVTADPVLVERAARRAVVDGRPVRAAVRIGAVVVAADGAGLLADVLGGDDLADRDLATGPDDERAVGDTMAGLLERADVVVLTSDPDEAGSELLDVLRRPGSLRLDDPGDLDGADLCRWSASADADAWIDPIGHRAPLGATGNRHVWAFELRTWRPFHPGRLVGDVELLAGGPRRSRGCFWVPGRPGTPVSWDGAGGHLGVGTMDGWHGREAFTRISVCGIGDEPNVVQALFERTVMTDAELAAGPALWRGDDGLEPWLGAAPGAA